MPNMYKDIVNGVNETVEIDGYPFYAEGLTSTTSYNYRKVNRQKLLGGTEKVTRGEYMGREYSFNTEVYTEGNPRIFDEIFREMMNKECEVISEYMGGKFKAEITIEREDEEASPDHITLRVDIKEIPEEQPNIPGDLFVVPEDVLQKENAEATNTETESNVTEVVNTNKDNKVTTPTSNKTKEEWVQEIKDKLKSRS